MQCFGLGVPMQCHQEFTGELVSVGATAPPCQSVGPGWFAQAGNREARPVTLCHFMEHRIHRWSTDFSVDFNSFFKVQPTNPGDISSSQTCE